MTSLGVVLFVLGGLEHQVLGILVVPSLPVDVVFHALGPAVAYAALSRLLRQPVRADR